MHPSDETSAEPYFIRSGGHLRYLGYITDMSDDAPVDDWFVTDSGGKVSWATSMEGAAKMCADAGYALEDWAFEADMLTESEVVDLDGLLDQISSPMRPSMGDRLHKAWMFFDFLGRSVGETFHHDALIFARLEDASGMGDGVLVSMIKQPWRRSLKWSDLELEAIRRSTRAGMQLLARSIAPSASA